MEKARGDFSGKAHLLLSFRKPLWRREGKEWVLGCRREGGTDSKIQKKQSSWLQVFPSIRGGESSTRARQSGPCQVVLYRSPSAVSSSYVTSGFEGLLAEGDHGHGQAGSGWGATVSHNRISSWQGGQPGWCPSLLCPLAP